MRHPQPRHSSIPQRVERQHGENAGGNRARAVRHRETTMRDRGSPHRTAIAEV
jgi:hypothetical protein